MLLNFNSSSMKKIVLYILLLLCTSIVAKSQNTVTIPDPNFANYISSHFVGSMNGNLLDTTNSSIISALSLDISNLQIQNLQGVQYFTSLVSLNCDNNPLTIFNALPPNLNTLYCSGTSLTSMPPFPGTLTTLYCSSSNLTSIGNLPSNLQLLNCRDNQLTALPNLPSSLTELNCETNLLTNLPSLPNGLITLKCGDNTITNLPSLPSSLQILICSANNLSDLPSLPASLEWLHCSQNLLTNLPVLPNNLRQLYCGFNSIQSLPTHLPDSLRMLGCNFNNLYTLPWLPDKLLELDCSYNNIQSVLNFPTGIEEIMCNNNNIYCFPTFPTSGVLLCFIDSNPFTCVPNFILAAGTDLTIYPPCWPGNTSECISATNINGFAYTDTSNNCLKDNGEPSKPNIPIQLFDNNNNLIAQTTSTSYNNYSFYISTGNYLVTVDTSNVPFTVNCSTPGIDSAVVINPGSIIGNVNFDIDCKAGFDIGVQSVSRNGVAFPGEKHRLNIVAGDMSNWYNLNCAAGVSGQLEITVTGNVSFFEVPIGALYPTIVGNVYTYNIADFGTVNFQTDFSLVFETDTTAQAGDQICVNITVNPSNGDNDSTNNLFNYCYEVVNSYDPNMKEVYPVEVNPGYDGWFTYTIHFQNTGNAPAINIKLKDTLDINLDLSTFQALNYSHANTFQLNENLLSIRFQGIMLPDSTTDFDGSQGFFQYRIKAMPNLPVGTQIENTAYIFFDYNPPIITNTVASVFSQDLSGIQQEIENFNISPNPSNGEVSIERNSVSNATVKIYNVQGEVVYRKETNKAIETLDMSEFKVGLYFIELSTPSSSKTNKLVISKN